MHSSDSKVAKLAPNSPTKYNIKQSDEICIPLLTNGKICMCPRITTASIDLVSFNFLNTREKIGKTFPELKTQRHLPAG